MFKGSVAILALTAMLAVPVASMAQTSPEAPAVPAATSAAAGELPQALKDLNLTDIKTKQDKRGGLRISGKTAEGVELRAMVDDKGRVIGAFAEGNGVLPQGFAQSLIPENVRNQQIYSQFATVGGAFSTDRGVMVVGKDADGQALRAGFSQDGTLMRFGRGEAGPGEHGPKGGHGDWGKRDKKGDARSWGGKGHGGKESRFQPLTDEAALKALGEAGYTEAGDITRDGPRVFVDAKNPQGETVRVEIGPKADVIRETAR